ncbi:MAG TPA: hypothetical protein VI953_01000 [Candidatus Paceibacterota bacterium]
MSEWLVGLSRNAKHFIDKNRIAEEDISDKAIAGARKLMGEDLNVNIKKMSGKWEGHHRIREGKLRIIVRFNFDTGTAEVHVVDWRGSAYR